tara:strand:+ start:10772 stop:11647 length:876 start_codon:yes stop_codon:yes gene_type:complete
MGVSRDFSEKLVFDFTEDAKKIVESYNLTHLRGTNELKPLNAIIEDFKLFIGATSAKGGVTESMLESESRMWLQKVEKMALALSKNEVHEYEELVRKSRKHTPSEDLLWRPIVRYAADYIDAITKKNSRFLQHNPRERKELDAKFSRMLRYIELEYQDDPSKTNADDVFYSVKKSIQRIDSATTENMRRKNRMEKKKKIDSMRRMKRPAKNPIKLYTDGFNGMSIGGVYGTSSRAPNKQYMQDITMIQGMFPNYQDFTEPQPGILPRAGGSLAVLLAAGLGTSLILKAVRS